MRVKRVQTIVMCKTLTVAGGQLIAGRAYEAEVWGHFFLPKTRQAAVLYEGMRIFIGPNRRVTGPGDLPHIRWRDLSPLEELAMQAEEVNKFAVDGYEQQDDQSNHQNQEN